MTPKLEFPDLGLREVRGAVEQKPNDARPNVHPADVHREYGIVRFKHPRRLEMHRSNQASFVGLVTDRAYLGFYLVGFIKIDALPIASSPILLPLRLHR